MKTYPKDENQETQTSSQSKCQKLVETRKSMHNGFELLEISNLQCRVNFESEIQECINHTKKRISSYVKFQGYRFIFDDCETETHKTKSESFKISLSEMYRNCFYSFDGSPNGTSIRISWNLNNEVLIKLIQNGPTFTN
jgi:hypothetical protein